MQDDNAVSVATFDKYAANYAEKYFALRDYDAYYALVAATLPAGPCKFLDLACGPGNVAAYILEHRPQTEILCVDASLQMLAEVKRRLDPVELLAADCRDLGAIQVRFDAAAFCFGLSYFDDADAAKVLSQLHQVLLPGSSMLLATVAGDPGLSGAQVNAEGDKVFNFYRQQAEIEQMLANAGFQVTHATTLPSPANASVRSNDVLVLCERQ